MGFFDKKYCDVCGEKIGLLGNRKLEDGNLCKDCAAKLSPFFSERKSSTVEEIKKQLAYREENRKELERFQATRIIGERMKVMVDEAGKRFVVTSSSDLLKANPDIISLSDVISCNLDLDVEDTELMQKDSQGKEVSYNPPRFCYTYTFYIEIGVRNPWFTQIRFRLNPSAVEIVDEQTGGFGGVGRLAGSRRQSMVHPEYNADYRKYQRMSDEIIAVLLNQPMPADILADQMVDGPGMFNQILRTGAGVLAGGMMQGGNRMQNGNMMQGGNMMQNGNMMQGGNRMQNGNMMQGGNMMQNGNMMQSGNMMQNGNMMQGGNMMQNGNMAQNGSWTCSCGMTNTGRFCQNCGAQKPEAIRYRCDKCGWEPADPAHPPKFCPQCGDLFDGGDRTN